LRLANDAGRGDSTYQQYDDRITAAAVDWLKAHASAAGNKPWVLFVSLVCPHFPLIARSEWYDLYPEAEVPLPALYEAAERQPDHPYIAAIRQCQIYDRSFDDVKLLSVSLDRLTRWYKPGLLAIGDAAHAMSPIGGIGISLAVQDAVAAANVLAEALASGSNVDPLLRKVQKRRMLPTRIVQYVQKLAQDRIFAPVLQPGRPINDVHWAVRLIDRTPLLQDIPAHFVGLGVRRERVRSPAAPIPS